MPTFDDPVQDAEEAREALRALAHATHTWRNPADTYAVLGSLASGIRSLQQVLDQTARAHLTHLARAHNDLGDAGAGSISAESAAKELQHAGAGLRDTEYRVNQAFQHSGRIAWFEPDQPSTDPTASGPTWDEPQDPYVAPSQAHDGIGPR